MRRKTMETKTKEQLEQEIATLKAQAEILIAPEPNSDTGEVSWKPAKGEIVKISLDYVNNREGESVLRTKSCAPLPVQSARNFTISPAKEEIPEAESQLQETEG